MCGILAILDPRQEVAPALYRGALALQHRGQDGAGIVTYDGRFHGHTGLGLLADVLRKPVCRIARAFGKMLTATARLLQPTRGFGARWRG